MALKRPLFVRLSGDTFSALFLSIAVSAVALAVVLLVPSDISRYMQGHSDFVGFVVRIILFIVFATGIALVPAGLLGLPLISFFKAQSALNLWICILIGFVAGLPLSLLISRGNFDVFLMFLWPNLLAAVLFYRLDQGAWFNRRKID